MTVSTPRARRVALGSSLLAAAAVLGTIAPAGAATTYPSDGTKPDIIPALQGYNRLWAPSGKNDLHGTVLDGATLAWNDRLTSWINQHATASQRFRALQNSNYLAADGSGYDQSITIADGLGRELGAIYAKGRYTGQLPLTTALINASTGATGAYVGTSAAKAAFSHPRPYLQADPTAAPVPGDAPGCAPSIINSSSEAANRIGRPWADAKGNLRITRVPAAVDKTHQFAAGDVLMDPGYGTTGLCTGGSFPSGHTTTAYQAGITLATLLPEVAPEILTRASEAGNNRIVLGVHYPLDIIGGRMDGEIALSARWSDKAFREQVIAPARKELVGYLTRECTKAMGVKTLSQCIAADTAYSDNPYAHQRVPGGSAQVVTNRASALRVYTERLSYGFKPTTATNQAPSVPDGAENLLLTTYPTLNAAQRRAILAQTEIASGNPLDTTAAHRAYRLVPASWQRLNLAAAMSAKVYVGRDGKARVLATGVKAGVVR